MGERRQDGDEGGRREELAEALARLKGEVGRIGADLERTAGERIQQRKPELRSAMDDLETAVDGLAGRAKELIAQLKARLDDSEDGGKDGGDERR